MGRPHHIGFVGSGTDEGSRRFRLGRPVRFTIEGGSPNGDGVYNPEENARSDIVFISPPSVKRHDVRPTEKAACLVALQGVRYLPPGTCRCMGARISRPTFQPSITWRHDPDHFNWYGVRKGEESIHEIMGGKREPLARGRWNRLQILACFP